MESGIILLGGSGIVNVMVHRWLEVTGVIDPPSCQNFSPEQINFSKKSSANTNYLISHIPLNS